MKIYSFIAEEQANNSIWTICEMCRVLEVSRSGFYDWQDRGPSDREVSDRRLAVEIEAIWECSDRTYGAPRVHRWLLKQGFTVGHTRVARIMAVNGWEGETGRRKVQLLSPRSTPWSTSTPSTRWWPPGNACAMGSTRRPHITASTSTRPAPFRCRC